MEESENFCTDTKEWLEKSHEIQKNIMPLLNGLTINQINGVLDNIKVLITHSVPMSLVISDAPP